MPRSQEANAIFRAAWSPRVFYLYSFIRVCHNTRHLGICLLVWAYAHLPSCKSFLQGGLARPGLARPPGRKHLPLVRGSGPPKRQMFLSGRPCQARPGQAALTKGFASWEGLGPSQQANPLVRSPWPVLAWPSRLDERICLLEGAQDLPRSKSFCQDHLPRPGLARPP